MCAVFFVLYANLNALTCSGFGWGSENFKIKSPVQYRFMKMHIFKWNYLFSSLDIFFFFCFLLSKPPTKKLFGDNIVPHFQYQYSLKIVFSFKKKIGKVIFKWTSWRILACFTYVLFDYLDIRYDLQNKGRIWRETRRVSNPLYYTILSLEDYYSPWENS